MKRLWLILPLALFGLFIGLAAYQMTQPKDEFVRSTMIGKPLPAFDLPGETEDAPRLTSQMFADGTPRLLNVWATWCLPCRAEMPWFVDFQTNFGGDGFRVLGVSLDEPGWSAVRPFLERQPVNYQIALADTTEHLTQFGLINILPTTWLIDRNGRIAAKHVGLVDRGELESEIDRLLNE